ncbi:MAG: hypothetical protein AAGD11_01885 [Planctomycetota bacterium]
MTLRATVALQCLGNWRWLTQVQETPLLHWMLDPVDVGGLAWSEPTAIAVQQWIGWLVLLAGMVVLWRPAVWVLAPIALVQTTITVAMWQIGAGYAWQVDWLPVRLLMLFPFASQLLRMAAPAALLMLSANGSSLNADGIGVRRTMQLLRWATAIVFVAHGIEAVQLNPKFIDLMIDSTARVFGTRLPEAVAGQVLVVIGVVDIAVALALVSTESLLVVGWIACWGLITATSRIVAHGWESSWHETLTRAPHFGAPLAVALWWHLLKSRSHTEQRDRPTQTANSSAENDETNNQRPATSMV